MSTAILFPHQLFEHNPLLEQCDTFYLVEEFLFFKQYFFHKQKIAFHRASMKFYEQYLIQLNKKVIYIDAQNTLSDIRYMLKYLHQEGVLSIYYIDTIDNWLEKRITETAVSAGIVCNKYESPSFLNSEEELIDFFSKEKRMFQTDFYKQQRIKRNILVENNKKPVGGQWTFDVDNRAKYPKGKVPPSIVFPESDDFYIEAIHYTETYFSDNYGDLKNHIHYPCSFESSKIWLHTFFKERFQEFGIYEDAIVANESVLNHSVLTPMLNAGLLTPEFIIMEALDYAENANVPLNSLEGFVRQIMGWREFIRAVYILKGTKERTKNYWGFTRKIPPSFWNATTGIEPIDNTIKKVLKTGYCHHIERLMVLGNFMLLCEFDPDDVYRWFMELFIDSYDWVMVPNVYGMSQFADGGLMATKPYISGSNYILKMSDYKKGDWQIVFDALFWRFMNVHRDFFLKNPRLSMLINTFDKMDPLKREAHLKHANEFLLQL